ncbi:MAG: hypothetical protein NDI61_11040 [Bdellovibrionaceae bacterium]|nr:hypothetical protein [Pseudobdellovibrionaceae bacterium]
MMNPKFVSRGFLSKVRFMMAVGAVVATTTMTLQADAARGDLHGHDGNRCTMIPPNTMRFARGIYAQGISEQIFNKVIDQVEKVYAPIVEANGGKLVVERKWDDDTVNAYARRIGKTWHVAMFGGLARHPEATPDGFAMVLCHELGHHLGGAPKYGGMDWASVEGQSDYFASAKCMRKVLEKVDNWEALRRQYAASDIDPLVAERCKAGQGTTKQQFATCVRSSMGGKALARLLGSLGGSKMPEFNTPDTSKVRSTMQGHPPAQCRLDTYFAGAVCPVGHEVDFDNKNPKTGACNMSDLAERRLSRREQVTTALGVRSACWYAEGSKLEPGAPLARR